MQVSNANNVKIYSVSSSASIPQWMLNRNKTQLKHDTAYRNRIELVQDLQFPEASMKLKLTPDGNFIMATGVYKPQIRVYELGQMAMKFERHTTAENVTFQILSTDWTKSVHLQTDRSIEFHSHYGIHYSTRVPKFGRDLMYHYPSCDLFVVGKGNEAYRINLEQGRFLKSLETSLPDINVCKINASNQLLAFGGSNGTMEFWDHRSKSKVGSLDVSASVFESVHTSLLETLPECTSLSFDSDGLGMMVGTSTGCFSINQRTSVII